MKRVIFLLSTCMIVISSHGMQLKKNFDFKAFFEKRDSTGKTYLHHTIKGGNAAKWQSGDLNDEVPSTEYLHDILATNAQLISYIIQADINVNIFDKKRRTPLFYAAKYKNEAAVKLLLEAGADPNIRNKEGIPPLVIACSIENNAAIITALLNGGARFRDLSEHVPRRLASSFESESECETILESALKTCPVNAVALLQYQNDTTTLLRIPQHVRRHVRRSFLVHRPARQLVRRSLGKVGSFNGGESLVVPYEALCDLSADFSEKAQARRPTGRKKCCCQIL